MYISETVDWSSDYNKSKVDQIASHLTTLAPITVFAPSGFGKSILLNYIAYNQKYRRRHRLKNTLIAYADATEMVAALKQLEPGMTVQTTINSILSRAIDKTLKQRGVTTKAYEDVIQLLGGVFAQNKRLSIYLIVDGLEQLIGDEFSAAREQLKYVRDNFRNRFDYIFGVGTAQAMKVDREKYGSLSTLVGQKLVLVGLSHNAKTIYSTQHKRKWYDQLWRSKFDEKYFAAVDYLSGGYVPYIKFLLRSDYKVGDKLALSAELISSSERLLQSLTPEMNQLLINMAQGMPIDKNTSECKMLKGLGIIVSDHIFSPILAKYLARDSV